MSNATYNSPTPPAGDWRRVALEIGERITDHFAPAPTAGPAGYYSMTPAQWREWAIEQLAVLKAEHDWLKTGFFQSLSNGPIKAFIIRMADGTEVVLGGDEYSGFKVSAFRETVLRRDDIIYSTPPRNYQLIVHELILNSGERISIEIEGAMPITRRDGGTPEGNEEETAEDYDAFYDDHDW